MPGEESVTITIAGESWEVTPLRGLKSIRMVPKVLSMASELVAAAAKSGIDVGAILTTEGELSFSTDKVLMAVAFISDVLGKRYTEFSQDIVPFLLQKDYAWLADNGSMGELFSALWEAAQFHISTSFGQGVRDAIKKSVTDVAEEDALEEPQPEKAG